MTSKARKNADKLNDIVNVREFGAVGDGVTNDTAAIKAAVASGAGSVYFPSGTYMCDQILWGNTTPNLGAIRLFGDVAALDGSFLEATSKTTRIKARSANSVFWRFNYSHHLVVENIAFHGGGFSDIVVQLQQGCTQHQWNKCVFEGATPVTGTLLYLGDDVINLQVDFCSFTDCLISGSYTDPLGQRPANALYIKQTNTISNKFINTNFFHAKVIARLQGSSQTMFLGCFFGNHTDEAIALVGGGDFNMTSCYTESTTGTRFLNLSNPLFSPGAIPIVLENNSINQTVGNVLDASPNLPFVFKNNRFGQEVFVQSPTSTTQYYPVIFENNHFLTGGITGPGQTKYSLRKANTLNGVPLRDTLGYWQEDFSIGFSAPSTVPGTSTAVITVPGAQLGDLVILSNRKVAAVPTNYILQATVTAADTVTLALTQITGAAAALSAENFLVTLIKQS
jgi:hypothetical protein